MPALNIKDTQVHALAEELARRTHKSLTDAVRDSLSESLARQSSPRNTERQIERVMRIASRIASQPILDPRSADEILGYNGIGIPE